MTTPAFADPAEAAAFARYREEQAEEYGTWVAVQDIWEGYALAYRTGWPVPKSNVEAHGYDKRGLVVRQGTVTPAPDVDRGEQLAARRAELERERAAIEAELAERQATAEPEPPAAPKKSAASKKEA